MQEYIMPLFKALRIALASLAFYMIFVNAFYVYYLAIGKRNDKPLSELVGIFFSKPAGVIICEIIFILGILSFPPIFSKFENTNIGSFLEKESYRESYYVYIRKNQDTSKAYKLKADIIKGNYGYESYTDEGDETFVIQGNGYFLEKVYWNKGGYLTFSHEDFYFDTSSTRIYPERETKVVDCHGDDYYVTLTREKAS